MKRTLTVAEARVNLPNLLHAVEHGEPVEITRSGFSNDFTVWRATAIPEDLDLPEDYFSSLRDRGPGRNVKS